MDTGSVVAIIISSISATSALCAILTFFINRGKDKHKDGIDSGNMRADIKYMRSGFDDLRLDVKEIARKQDRTKRQARKSRGKRQVRTP